MRRRLLATAALLTALGFTFPVAAIESLGHNISTQPVLLAQSNWQAFTSESGKFAVQMPEKPSAEITTPIKFGGEQINLHQVTAQNKDNVYVVVYADLPSFYLQKEPETVLDEISAQLLRDMGLPELKSSGKKIELDGNPGREFQASGSGKYLGMRLYLVGQRSYLLLSQSQDSEDVNQFLSSFQLAKLAERGK
jgi:hypothetical protein